MRRTARLLGRGALLALALACTSVVIAAQPASAHGLGGIEPTNYESTLRRVTSQSRLASLRAFCSSLVLVKPM